jgi:hypothetical protein
MVARRHLDERQDLNSFSSASGFPEIAVLQRKHVAMQLVKRVADLIDDRGHLALRRRRRLAFGFEAAQHHMKSW